MPDYTELMQIRDPATRRAIKRLMDRVTTDTRNGRQLAQDALKSAKSPGGVALPTDGRGLRIRNVKAPVHGKDVVTLEYLQTFMAEVESRSAGGEGGEGGETENEFGKIGKGSAPPTVELAEMGGDVAAYAGDHPTELANSCASWTYITGLVAYLQGIDPRVGGNGKRGNTSDPSMDAIAYYHGAMPPVSGSNDVYVVDVIGCHCPLPTSTCVANPVWNNVTTSLAYGAWLPSL